MDWDPDLELHGSFIRARPYRPRDKEELFQAVRESYVGVGRWLPWCHSGYRRSESEKWVTECKERWQRGESYDFAVFDSRTERFCGAASINRIQVDHRIGNVGYWVRSSETGRGIATEATCLVARFGFETLKLERLEIVIAKANVASVRVAEKAGARREAVLRRRLWLHGESHDAVMLSLLREDLVLAPRDSSS